MNILIAYAGKTGTTEHCAHLLGEKLSNVTYADLTKEDPDPSEYGTVIVGASIRMGMIHKAAKRWIVAHWDVIRERKNGYFICCGFAEQGEQMLEQNFSKELRDGAFDVACFGGELDPSKQKGFDKFVVKMVTKQQQSHGKDVKTRILTERIDTFAEKCR